MNPEKSIGYLTLGLVMWMMTAWGAPAPSILLISASAQDSVLQATWEEIWAGLDGLDPEVFILMQNADAFMAEAIRYANLAEQHQKQDQFQKWLNEQLIQITSGRIKGYHSATTKMAQDASAGYKGWMDWRHRHHVQTVYQRYKKFVMSSKSQEIALEDLNWWLEDEKRVHASGIPREAAALMNANKDLLFVMLLSTHDYFYGEPDAPRNTPATQTQTIPQDQKEAKENPEPNISLDGLWHTHWGRMHLKQEGNKVHGEYSRYEENGKIQGTLENNVLRGTWEEGPSFSAPDDAGELEWTLTEDGKRMKGKWRHGSNGSWREDWKGSRNKEKRFPSLFK